MNPTSTSHPTVKGKLSARCLDCGAIASVTTPVALPENDQCPTCGSTWRNAYYDYTAAREILPKQIVNRPFNLWRYLEILPIENPDPDLVFGEGGTPLIRAKNLGNMLGCANIYVKDERQGPTASFKDRQAAVTISALKEAGITEAVIASTGNVAISYSAYAARAGIKLWAFLTSLVPVEKMREVAIYGTQVVKVTATYDQTKHIAAEFARARGFYFDRGARSIPAVEAMKTLAYEIAEQIAQAVSQGQHPLSMMKSPFRSPDWYIQAVSGGLGPVGVQKGFRELLQMNLVDQMPAFALVQTEGCDPMVQAWQNDSATATPIPSPRTHIATLSTGDPGRSYTLLYEQMKANGRGSITSVTDEEAFRAMHIAAKMEGLSVEPATAVAFAGLIKLVRSGMIKPTDVIVLNCTGHTMPIESHILGDNWSRDVSIHGIGSPAASQMDQAVEDKPTKTTLATGSQVEVAIDEAETQLTTVESGGAAPSPEEGLLAALSRITPEKYPEVLVVDDHPDARRLIMRILQSQGEYVLLEAKDGAEAINLAHQHLPSLIILDLMMPKIDGFGVLDGLQSSVETAAIPVIVVTAKELTRQEKKRLAGRIQSLMQKGQFMDDDLLHEIQNLDLT